MASQSVTCWVLSSCSPLLYPFIDRIGDKVQVHRVHDHVHMDPVVDGEAQTVRSARNCNLLWLQRDVVRLRLIDDYFLQAIVGDLGITVAPRDVIERIL